MPSDPIPEPNPEPKPLTVDFDFLIDLDWPAQSAEYYPDIEVFPLVNMPGVYKAGVTGQVTFVGKNLQPFQLPFQPASFGYIQSGNIVKGYVLMGVPDYRWNVLMLADGTIPRGTDGQYISLVDLGHNSAYFVTIGSTVITFRPIIAGGEWTDSLYGLYDMKEQKELLPCEYEAIDTIDGFFGVMKDDRVWLVDEKGNEIYAFDPQDAIRVWMNDLGESWSGYDQYYISRAQQVFYRFSDLELWAPRWFSDTENDTYRELQRWNEYYITSFTDGTSSVLSVFGPDGRLLYKTDCDYFYIYNEYLVFKTEDALIVLDGTLREKRFPVPLTDNYLYFRHYDGREIFYEEGGVDGDPLRRYLALDERGTIREATYVEAGQSPILYRYPGHDLFIGPNHEVYAEIDGSILLRGDFAVLLAREDTGGGYSMRADPKTIFALDGRVLLDDIYGCIYEAPGPGGGLFVYLDANTCVLLYPDGSSVPIPGAPIVERMYWGG